MSQRSQAPAPHDFPSLLSRRLDWSELDVLGHANNARYFTWFEEARMHFFKSVGVPVTGEEGWGPILAHTDCQFLAPVEWPAQLQLGAQVESVGRSSFKMSYAVFVERGSDEAHLQCVAMGSGVIVLVRYESGEKVLIPEELRARLLKG